MAQTDHMRSATSDEQQRPSKEALRAAEELSRCVIESSWDCIKILDMDGNLLLMNRHGQRMLEIEDVQALLNRPWTDLWREADHASALAAVEAAQAGGVGRFSGICRTGKGEPRWWDVLVTPVLNSDARPERLLVISRDITTLKAAEQEHQKRNQELYDRVAELRNTQGELRNDIAARTEAAQAASWEAEELERRSRELARSNAELEQFASIVSHDLRSPLLSINGCVELLAEQAQARLQPEDRELIAMVRSSVRTMSDLIKGLLDYARVDAGGLKRAPCDCERLLGRVLGGLSKFFDTTGAVITHDPLPVIPADERLLVHVFQNLLENAVEFRSSEPPRIHIGVERKGRDYVLSIRDNGLGIDPQHHSRIFDMFKRVHREGRRDGSGIGLAVCKKVVELHGGEIWVRSEPGAGSTFYFRLPAF